MKKRIQFFYLGATLLLFSCIANAQYPDTYPKPIIYREVFIPKEVHKSEIELRYTDCVETSFLRFVQVVLIDPKNPSRIDPERLKALTDNREIIEYFETYPEILESDDYAHSPHGMKARLDWAILLAQRGMIYNKLGRFEVQATLNNFFSLFFWIFHQAPTPDQAPSPTTIDDYQRLLDQACQWISLPQFQWNCTLSQHTDQDLGEELIYRSSLIDLKINSRMTYQWDIHEFIQDGIRVSGHSEITAHLPH